MKQVVTIFTVLLVSSLMISIGTVVLANDTTTVEPAQIDRVAMIEELVRQWGHDDTTAYQLRGELEQADDSKLLAVWQADSLDDINTILRGGVTLDGTLTLNDTDEDYTFTPVTPCRIVDTRNAGGIISAGSTREFFAYGPGSDMTPQGGNAAGCNSPVAEPLGVMINVTAVPSANGNLRAYAANVSTPTASLVNYKSGVNIANAAAVKTYFAFGPKELEIYSSANSHVIIDVMGFYDMPEATALEVYTTSAVTSIAAGAVGSAFSPECLSGYRVMGGGCTIQNDDRLHATRPSPTSGTPTRWECRIRNYLGVSQDLTAYVTCARVPGR